METLVRHIRERYLRVKEQVAQSAFEVGRDPKAIRILVVTKTQPLEVVKAAIEAGITLFGENYPEEALPKILALQSQPGIEWHMIGHLQSRKARIVVEHFSVMETIDRVEIAEKLNRFAQGANRVLPVMLELNVSGEESKFGFPAWDEQTFTSMLGAIEKVVSLSNLSIKGLMTMPPLFEKMEESRPYFVKLRKIQDSLRKIFPQVCWDELSMGTSADFPVAVQEGATIIRIGTAILGPRRQKTV